MLNDRLSYNNKSAFYQLELKACVSGSVSRAGGSELWHWLTEGRLSPQDSGGTLNGNPITQCSQPVFVSISVIDEPDLDPRFVREFYSASVPEDATVVCAGDVRAWGRDGCLRRRSDALTEPPPRGRPC